MRFKLASINPNINGIYYEIDSYNNAIKEYSKREDKILYSNYTNRVYNQPARLNEPIGDISIIDLENREVEVSIYDCFSFIRPENYYVGFSLYAEKLKENIYRIQNVEYLCLIPKEDIDIWTENSETISE